MIRLLKTFGLRKTIRILHLKWVRGECRHLCDTCEYTQDCFFNYEE